MEKIIRYKYDVRVRYADTDKMGVVYNGNYFRMFEIGRSELMRHYGAPYTDIEAAGYLLPLIESRAFYHNSAYYDDILQIESSFELEVRPKIRFDYNIFRNDTIIATGYTIHIFMKRENNRPVKPPAIFKNAIEKILSGINK